MIISIELRPLFRWRAASGKRGAASASLGAVCCQRVAVAWVVGRWFGSVRWCCFDAGGVSLFGAYVRRGLPCRKSFPDCPTMRTHAREQQEAADLATMYILSQGIAPRPGWFSSLFERFKAREACTSSPPVLFPCLFSFPLKTKLHFLTHAPTPLSLKISPSIEFLSFRQTNYALNLK